MKATSVCCILLLMQIAPVDARLSHHADLTCAGFKTMFDCHRLKKFVLVLYWISLSEVTPG